MNSLTSWSVIFCLVIDPVLSTYSKLNNKDLDTQSTGIFSAEDKVLLQSRLKGNYVTVKKKRDNAIK